ncbi:hypothetical protein [Streptomyces sp. NPDC058307]|uniref:hypothetical protein n=1 Tax=Streptomyces sp. NPDC058307 TaxID=3346439 RepID=UPI0036EC0EB0
MPPSTQHPLPRRHLPHARGPLGLHLLPPAAADLVPFGDLTGRYATGSYSRLASDGRAVVLRADRQGAAEHGHRISAAIACHMSRAGGTLDQLTQLLLHPEHEGGRHARHIALRSGQTRALDYIRRVWTSASETVSATRMLGSRHEAYEVLAALRDRIETTRGGRAGWSRGICPGSGAGRLSRARPSSGRRPERAAFASVLRRGAGQRVQDRGAPR